MPPELWAQELFLPKLFYVRNRPEQVSALGPPKRPNLPFPPRLVHPKSHREYEVLVNRTQMKLLGGLTSTDAESLSPCPNSALTRGMPLPA
jgi:hypothetical protein